MPWKSRWQAPIPLVSLPTYVFQSPTAPLSDKPLLIDADHPEYYLSHHSYREWSKRFAAGLLAAGFAQGDRLLLYSGNTLFFPPVLQGTIMAGGIFTGANPQYVAREVAYQLKDSEATFLLVAEGSIATALDAIAMIGFPRERLFVMGDGLEIFENRVTDMRQLRHWTNLLAPESEGAKFEWEQLTTLEQTDRIAVINYSSGTTGIPKGVEISHRNYVANCAQTEYTAKLAVNYEESLARAVGLSYLPLYHAYGQTRHCVSTVRKGIPVYVMRKFDFIQMLRHIEKYRVTDLNLVPPIAVAFTKRPEIKHYDLSSVESAMIGAAPTSAETVMEFEKIFKNRFCLRQGWGQSEITCSGCTWDPNEPSEPHKVGELYPNIEGKLVDDDGIEVRNGERGELYCRGPNVMRGYWKNPKATEETITADRWLKTGDIAIRHPDGKLSIVDRKKELIKVKGNQVAPAELEGVLLEHPAIQDAAVVGVTVAGDEKPRAYVVPQAGQSIEPEEVASWLAKRVAPHKRLTGGVVLTGTIPKNPSGKIQRKIMRDRAKAEVGDRVTGDARL